VAEVSGADLLGALTEAYRAVSVVVSELAVDDWARPTRCEGWCVRDVLFHLMLDPQRALVAFATPSERAATSDLVAYWRSFRPGTEPAARHANYVRRASAAYLRTSDLAEDWEEASEAALRAAATAIMAGWAETQVVARTARRRGREDSAPMAARVQTQGLVIAVPDFLATLTVEAALHLLDLTMHLPHPPPVPPAALAIVRLTLGGLLGTPLPAGWDGETCALKGTGRMPLDGDDRTLLGLAGDRFPLLA
jgi:hypothetical protein